MRVIVLTPNFDNARKLAQKELESDSNSCYSQFPEE